MAFSEEGIADRGEYCAHELQLWKFGELCNYITSQTLHQNIFWTLSGKAMRKDLRQSTVRAVV